MTKPNPLEINDIETFQVRFADCVRQKDQELAESKALMAVDAPVAEEESESTKLAKGLIKPEPSKYTRRSEEHFTATAAEFLNIYVGLMPQPETDAAFVKMIQESCLGPSNVKGVPGKNAVLIYCDNQLIGESLRRPSTRLPPIEDNLLHTLIGNALKARGSTPIGKGNTQVDCPIEGDIVIVNDGGQGNDLCLAPFRSAKTRGTRSVNGYLEIFDLNVVISQDSIKSKKKRNRGPVNQIQRLSFITRECLDRMVPERKHDKYTGSNRGNVLAFVGLASSAQTWHTTVEDKKVAWINFDLSYLKKPTNDTTLHFYLRPISGNLQEQDLCPPAAVVNLMMTTTRNRRRRSRRNRLGKTLMWSLASTTFCPRICLTQFCRHGAYRLS